MTSDDRHKISGRAITSDSNDQAGADSGAEVTRRRRRHRRRRFAGGDDPDRRRTARDGGWRVSGAACRVVGRQRVVDECVGRDRTDTGPDNRQEIVSKLRVGACQCVCLGSDQDESPVTTSNFLRSELTSWGALSCVDRCSRRLMIFESASSTSVMALSE